MAQRLKISKQALLCPSGGRLVAFTVCSSNHNQTGFWAKMTNTDQFTPTKKMCGMMVKVTIVFISAILFKVFCIKGLDFSTYVLKMNLTLK